MAKRKSSKLPGTTFPLKLTQQQRMTVVAAPRMRRKFVNRLKDLPPGPQTILYAREELEEFNDALSGVAHFAVESEKQPLLAVLRQIGDLLAAVEERSPRGRPADGAELLLQFKVTLLDTKPPIWRRIQMEDGTLADLHDCIQAAMGWEDCHLHQFEINGERYGVVPEDDMGFDLEAEDEAAVRLADLVPQSGRQVRWIYNYDFGDDWRHEILFEGFVDKKPGRKYPLCLEGARACPPEDCGGPWGYATLLSAQKKDEEQDQEEEEALDWSGPIDPDDFDAQKATKAMRRSR